MPYCLLYQVLEINTPVVPLMQDNFLTVHQQSTLHNCKANKHLEQFKTNLFNQWFSVALACSVFVGLTKSTRLCFIIAINLIFVQSFGCINWVSGPLCRPNCFMCLVIGITSGPRLKICRQPSGDLCLWERECWSILSVSGFCCS